MMGRAPLSDLPLAMFTYNVPPSPRSPAKRPAPLGTDELGVGKSPARRLFATKEKVTPRRSTRIASKSERPADRERDRDRDREPPATPYTRDTSSIHDPGFAILSDDDPRARSKKSSTYTSTLPHDDKENVALTRRLGRSKLNNMVIAPESPPEHGTPGGKEGLKIEVEGES